MRKTFHQKRIKIYLCSIAMAILLLLPAISLWANPLQSTTITGTVTSASDGEPLIGVSVAVKGTGSGTITDLDGKYSLSVTSGDILQFSYVGYVIQEITYSGQQVINVTLSEDAEMLDEVVVVGYGVQKKKLVTGATVQVKGENIAKLNTTNPLQAMQGQTPGVSISSTSGQPGSDMKVSIRGLGTVGNSSPLYLIDGVGGDISTLNPADIESIDVLKDAASAAIYGAQAANGVVLITTKSGKEGKAQVTFDAYYGVQNVARKANMLNAQQYMTIMDEQALNSGNAVYDWGGYTSIYDANGNVYNTDWVDAMFKDNATTESYTLGISGGSATSTYAISLGYMNQEGVVGGADVSNYERYNFRINSEHKLFNNFLKIGEQVSFVYKKNNGIGVGNQYNNTLRGAFGTSPIVPIYSDNNKYDSPYNDTTDSDWNKGDGNPYGQMMTNTNNENKTATFNGNLYAEIEPIKNLKLRTVFGIVYNSSEYRDFKPLYRFSQYTYNDTRTEVSQNMNHGLGMTWTNTATYDWTINEHSFNALLGMEAYRYEGTYLRATNGGLKEGFDSWQYAYINNGTASSSTEGLGASGNPHDDSRSVSYFARLGWNWKETYMVNATMRADGSSRFASGNRFGYFPSVSAGWTISNEAFMENTQSWLDFLKIRASWGQVGNQNISNYQYLAPIRNTNTHYLFGSGYGDADAASQLASNWGAYPSRLANPNVKWETSEQTNIGFDARFLNSRLSANFDFYLKETKDWLVEAPILATVGAGAPYINGGSVKNTGVELALTWNDRVGKDFNYTIGLNGAYNKNKVGQIPTEDGIIHGSTNQLYDNSAEFYRAENGKPIGYFWGYKTAGLFQNTQEIADWIAAGNGVLQSDVQPGDVKYIDVNHDGVINDNDKVNLGNGMPDFTFGINLGFDYKGFDFSILANGAAGQQIVQSYRNHTGIQANYTTAILDRWTGEGTSNRIPRVTNQNINWQFSDLYVQDADYMRISNITIGYDFSRLLRKSRIFSQARVYAQVQNAFTFTKYDGMDPEIGYGPEGDGGQGWASGIDIGYYPRPRTILFGVNLKF
ncbi:TonB-dependent receptor [Bacteroides sp. 519]|uniref:SusC/RagA family TonB-linked outer membrane protein n=1 Tax=Bacteroides sp. 519 TaxID=2302937 RepID=UPI0013D4255C|nr:TonB-dependent receptor [Bacteroides sp. 519]NDV60394.1 TonB-dependent receptor [Bacteroides sp. 519]